jgi:hypothetical protein
LGFPGSICTIDSIDVLKMLKLIMNKTALKKFAFSFTTIFVEKKPWCGVVHPLNQIRDPKIRHNLVCGGGV